MTVFSWTKAEDLRLTFMLELQFERWRLFNLAILFIHSLSLMLEAYGAMFSKQIAIKHNIVTLQEARLSGSLTSWLFTKRVAFKSGHSFVLRISRLKFAKFWEYFKNKPEALDFEKNMILRVEDL